MSACNAGADSSKSSSSSRWAERRRSCWSQGTRPQALLLQRCSKGLTEGMSIRLLLADKKPRLAHGLEPVPRSHAALSSPFCQLCTWSIALASELASGALAGQLPLLHLQSPGSCPCTWRCCGGHTAVHGRPPSPCAASLTKPGHGQLQVKRHVRLERMVC